jgi:hypothetical protein
MFWSIGIFFSRLAHFMAKGYLYFVIIWYIFPRFGMLHQEKSGNPASCNQM